ncbi:MAG: phage tail protein [bacterium]|nr:phage tail protein [bacterium]
MIAALTSIRLFRGSDPLLNFRFHAEVDGMLLAGFSEVTGLSVEIETEDYQEGGVNDFVHKLPKTTKYPNLVLKQGITYSSQMWDWIENVVHGKIETKNGRILLMDFKGIPMWYWNFENAYPVKWSGTDLKGTANEPFIETLELAHTGITKERSLFQAAHALL